MGGNMIDKIGKINPTDRVSIEHQKVRYVCQYKQYCFLWHDFKCNGKYTLKESTCTPSCDYWWEMKKKAEDDRR